jgi:hypothetical protein
MDIIKDIVSDVYDGKYNNHFHLEENFRDDLEKKLRNEPNKNQFLESLKQTLILESDKHLTDCKEKDCRYSLNKNSSIKIIDAILNDMKEKEKQDTINIDYSINKNIVSNSTGVNINQNTNTESKENWFKKNVKYFYYTGGSIGLIYGFYKWILPLF